MTDYFGAMGSAIFSTLSNGTALINLLGGTAIYSRQAPDEQELPYVVFSLQGGGPENNPAGMRDNVWHIRGYDSIQATANAIDGEIDALITNKQLTVTGFSNFWTARETDISLVENPQDGEKIYSVGALYRIRLGY